MNRRTFLATSVLSTVAAGLGSAATAAERYFPVTVDQTLFESINRVKVPGRKSPLEMSHAPYLTAPKTVKAGEMFTVEVSVGEKVHVMGASHWIEYIELAVGNEPVGRVNFESRGIMKPKAVFTLALPGDSAPNGIVTLVAYQRCNLHGLWEATFNVSVS